MPTLSESDLVNVTPAPASGAMYIGGCSSGDLALRGRPGGRALPARVVRVAGSTGAQVGGERRSSCAGQILNHLLVMGRGNAVQIYA